MGKNMTNEKSQAPNAQAGPSKSERLEAAKAALRKPDGPKTLDDVIAEIKAIKEILGIDSASI